VLTRADLEHTCSCGGDRCPGRNTIFRARCHPDAGTRASYWAERGQLVLACAECSTGLACFQVAWAVPS
jgi:hypothetical protein